MTRKRQSKAEQSRQHDAVESVRDSLEHLQLELARIDILLRREVHRWQLANQNPADTFRGFYVSHQEANTLLERSLCTSWGQTVTLSEAEAQYFEQAYAQADEQAKELTKKSRGKSVPRLIQLSQSFNLSQYEQDALLVCLAPTLDLRYEQIFGYLQDHVARKRPSVNVMLNLLSEPGVARLTDLAYFDDKAPLIKYQLLHLTVEQGQSDSSLLSQALMVDDTVAAWLRGQYQPAPDLRLHVSLTQPTMDNNAQLLTSNVQEKLQTAAEHQPVLVFFGVDVGRQRAAAQFLAAQRNRSLLEADLKALTADKHTPLQAIRMILRDARLTGAIAYLSGWDVALENRQCPPEILAEICDHPDLVIVAGQMSWQTDGLARRRPLEWHEFGQPTYTQRRDLWLHHLAEQYPVNADLDISPLSDQFYLTSDQIRDSVRTAVDIQLQRGTPLTLDDLYIAARKHSSSRLNTLAQQIRPRFTWSDLILPQDQITMLGEIVNMAKGRSVVLEQWSVGKKLTSSRGIAVLFSGEPGTGKTMSAEVISGELGLDMYKIDLSSIVSKYIGETEKNLERIFVEAESSNTILFFDEADALFGKRSEVSDAHDRYANIETSYLLQRMEAYNGITILATNMRGNLDEAFTRRMAFAVAFPFPDEEHRLRIWETLFPDTVPRGDDVDLSYLAKQYKLAGGNIRNIIVNSAYLAATNGGMVQMQHLMHSTMRELQKMGKVVRKPDKQFVAVKG